MIGLQPVLGSGGPTWTVERVLGVHDLGSDQSGCAVGEGTLALVKRVLVTQEQFDEHKIFLRDGGQRVG